MSEHKSDVYIDVAMDLFDYLEKQVGLGEASKVIMLLAAHLIARVPRDKRMLVAEKMIDTLRIAASSGGG